MIHSKTLQVKYALYNLLIPRKMERLRSPPALQNLPPSLSTEHQSWLLRLDCDRRPPREKIEATEWAKPTTIPTFTWPLLGIGRPENLCEKFPPLIMALLPPAMAFLRRSKGWWGECKEYDSGMVVGWTVKGRWLYI